MKLADDENMANVFVYGSVAIAAVTLADRQA